MKTELRKELEGRFVVIGTEPGEYSAVIAEPGELLDAWCETHYGTKAAQAPADGLACDIETLNDPNQWTHDRLMFQSAEIEIGECAKILVYRLP